MEPKTTLNEVIADAVKNKAGQGAPRFVDGSLIYVPLDLLDPNPWQPRSSMDEGELESLMGAIVAQGLIQPIAVRPTKEGRFITVAGHRRSEAYRRLRAKEPGEKWATIPGQVKLALDDSQLAAQAYMENMSRAALSLLDELRALEKMMAAGLADSNESLAALTQQSVHRIKRLRRLSSAPEVLKQCLANGVKVVVGKDADGREVSELRRLDLIQAIAFAQLHEHFLESQPPARAAERLETAVRRALAGNWSKQRVEDHVKRIISGQEVEAPDEEPDAAGVPEASVFQLTPKRFVVDLALLKKATPAQLERLRAEFARVVAERASGASGSGAPVR